MTNLNKDVKVFFIDLDGTLLDVKKDGKDWISKENTEAIRKVQKEGKQVVISTGRFPIGLGVHELMKLLNLKYAVTANGSIVVDQNGKKYKDDRISLKQAHRLFEIAKENKLSLRLNGDLESFGSKSALRRKVSRKFGLEPKPDYSMPMDEEFYKVVLWGKTKKQIEKLRKYIQKEIKGVSVVSSTGGWSVEMTSNKATKGLANIYVANKLLKITKRNEMLHMGDTLNDSTVLDFMPLCAMGNATKSLKDRATFIGPNSKVGGVGKILMGEYKKIER